MKKILIISNSYPYSGGQSNTAYNLLKLLQQHQLEVQLVYINYIKDSDADPDLTGASHKIMLRKNIFYHCYHWLRRRNSILLARPVLQLKDYYFLLRVVTRLSRFLLSNKFSPDLVITNIPTYHRLIQKLFGNKKLLLIIGGSPEMEQLVKHGIDAQALLTGQAGPALLQSVPAPDFRRLSVLFNSQLTRQVYQALGARTGFARAQYFNLVPAGNAAPIIPFADRQYDIVFIASDYQRRIKNAALAYRIFEHFGDCNKIAIGKGHAHFAALPRTTTLGLRRQEDVLAVLADARLLIIPSYYDSSPGVLSEAISSGCNVLVSRNVGWHEELPEESVVTGFARLEEWTKKAEHLLRSQPDYSAFNSIMSDSEHEILNSIREVLEH